MSGRNNRNNDNNPILRPSEEDNKCYNRLKLDNRGLSVSNEGDDNFVEVLSVTNNRITFSKRFWMFIGELSLTDFIIHIIRDQLGVKQVIQNIIIAFLDKWITFNEDGSLRIKGSTFMNSDVTVINTLNVTGTTSMTGNVTLANN